MEFNNSGEFLRDGKIGFWGLCDTRKVGALRVIRFKWLLTTMANIHGGRFAGDPGA